MTGAVAIRRVRRRLPAGLARLEAEAAAEGFDHLAKLRDEWHSGAARFDRSGEALFAAFRDGRAVAVGGVLIDPYRGDPTIGRMRRFYVSRAARGSGIGAALVEACLDAAAGFALLRLRAATPEAARFWEARGFEAVALPDASHTLIPADAAARRRGTDPRTG
jgi:GNAT superfamily N-acetyltransferase